MVSIKVRGFEGEATLVFAVLFAIALLGSAPLPVLAQASGSWTNTGTLNIPRGHSATLLANGLVLVAGVMSSSGTILASAELYDPASGKWTITDEMANARANHTATVLVNGEVLVVGGLTNSNPQSPCTAASELYNASHRRMEGHWQHERGSLLARCGPGEQCRALRSLQRYLEDYGQHECEPCFTDDAARRWPGIASH
jgi:hypothetical protein